MTMDSGAPGKVTEIGAGLPGPSLFIPVTVACGNFMTGLDQNVVVTALPRIGQSLGEPPSQLGLVMTAYVMALIVAMPASGWAADRIGVRRAYCGALAVFALSSVACGLSDGFWMLVAARVCQGVGGALMGTLGQVVILGSFPRDRTLKINMYMAVASQTGPMVGPLLGGALTTYVSWRWIFFINIPLALGAALSAGRFFPSDVKTADAPFDFIGFGLIGTGVALLVLGMDELGADTAGWIVAAQLAASALILALAVSYSLRTAFPLLNLRLLAIRTFRISLLTGGGLDTIGLTSVIFLLPLMLQVGFGMTAVGAGALTFLMAAGAWSMRLAMPPLLRRFGFRRVLLTNTPIVAALVAGFSLFRADTPIWLMAAYIFIIGLFRTVQWASTGNLSYSDIPPEELGRFSALFYVLWQSAVVISFGTAAALLSSLAGPDQRAAPADFRIVFLVEAAVTLCALIAYSRLKAGDGVNVSGYSPATVE